MKYLVISDLHLKETVHKKQLESLRHMITDASQVFILGDFIEVIGGIDLDKFLQSRWIELFPLLLSKKCIFIYGNHDYNDLDDVTKKRMEGIFKLFSISQHKEYKLKLKLHTYTFIHGDSYRVGQEGNIVRLFNLLFDHKFIRKPFVYLAHYLARYPFGYNIFHYIGKKFNKAIVENYFKQKNNLDVIETLIFGDSHSQFDGRNDKYKWLNLGHNLNPERMQYIIIDEVGNLELKDKFI